MVEVEGDDLGLLDDASLTRHRADRVGFVWQGAARNLVPYLSAIDNVRLPRRAPRRTAHLRRGSTAETTAEELLELVGLSERAHHLPAQLSGGEQQRTAVAVALANDPALLLADEPTGELDGASAARVLDVFRDVSARLGTTIVMSTHDLLAARAADRRVYLRHGRASEAGVPLAADRRGRHRATPARGRRRPRGRAARDLDRVGRRRDPPPQGAAR